ncbi:MAG: delta 1-pyrroline-5-carboxylate reductase [Erythrobacter sp. SCN 62-14]|nr:MAG: delta 1-pyrroline-5-carboxylate reductase [Erythrobacter sp. SCN 62-14]
MSTAIRIAHEEWRLWLRSRMVVAAALIVAVLIAATGALTMERLTTQAKQRAAQQEAAEAAFFAQPDRHPHRMVHYGHYAFRLPPPLSVFDPGVDMVTGQSIFLEGHRQNTAMFADAKASANMGGFAALNPAALYQLLLPLLLIIIGHGVVLRERESGTLGVLLAQGQSALALAGGKALALLGVVALFMLPLALMAAYGVAAGEAAGPAIALVAGYGLYLMVWAALVLAVSTLVRSRSAALGVLTACWLAMVLVVPRLGINAASALVDAPGKIESDLVMLSQERKLGDGHNASDPAFEQLKQDLLDQYGVESVEELPINFRGVVASYSEEKLTGLLNEFAERRMQSEARQSEVFGRFALASPTLAVGAASRALAGTDLATHHRFLRETESVRFGFVQALNEMHATKLSYIDDARRSVDPEAEARTRVNAQAWAVLDRFRFAPDPPAERFARAFGPLTLLAGWLAALAALVVYAARRLAP